MIGSISRQSDARLEADGAHVREVDLLRVAQIAHQATGGAHGRRPSLHAEAFEAVRLELLEQRLPRRLGLEAPRIGTASP